MMKNAVYIVEIGWKPFERFERVPVVVLISADQPFDKFVSRKIYIYIYAAKKKGRRYTREDIL